MTRLCFRRRVGWICFALAVIGLGYALVDPTSQSIPRGQLRGESFYRGKPTNYWVRVIEEQDRVFFSRWSWINRLVRPLIAKQRAERDRRLQSLLKGDPAAVPVLIELLRHKSEDVRVTATQGLRAVGPAARDATPALARGLSNTEEVQEKSFQALAAIGSPGARAAIPTLKAIIRAGPGLGPAFHGYAPGDSYSRKWPGIAAATVLWHIAPGDNDILPMLLQALNDQEEPDKRLLRLAIETLGAIGPHAGVAVPRLLDVIKTEDNEYVVGKAVEAIKKIDAEAAATMEVK